MTINEGVYNPGVGGDTNMLNSLGNRQMRMINPGQQPQTPQKTLQQHKQQQQQQQQQIEIQQIQQHHQQIQQMLQRNQQQQHQQKLKQQYLQNPYAKMNCFAYIGFILTKYCKLYLNL